MRRHPDAESGLLLRIVTSITVGVSLWVFLPILDRLGLLTRSNTFIPVLGVLVILQWVPWRTVRFVGGMMVSVEYIVHYFSRYSGTWWFRFGDLMRIEWSEGVRLLTKPVLLDPLQTHLFLVLLCAWFWILVYSARRTWLWLLANAVQIIILAAIDGNTAVKPNAAIVVVLFVTLAMQGIRQFFRFRPHIIGTRRAAARFFAPLVTLTVASLGIAVLLPKQAAVWGNPIAWVNTRWAGRTGSTPPPKLVIGYQADNSRLGGALSMSSTPVMSVVTSFPSYLRGRGYADYTGEGWLPGSTPSNTEFSQVVPNTGAGELTTPTRPISQQVKILSNSLHADVVFGAYSMKKVTSVAGPPLPNGLFLSSETGSIYTSLLQPGETYSVLSAEPVDPTEVLKKSTGAVIVPKGMAEFVALPSTLPKQVRDLAASITAQDHTEYEKVVAIQNYLKSHYDYSVQGIPVPGPGQDYVDQFLFETKKGYCNNFSSSMAVMLRTLGIPTRWVVGFTQGHVDLSYTGAQERYIIRNEDAHSWVEVYFPSAGWIPFDPTPFFTFPYVPANSKAGQTTPPVSPQPIPKQPAPTTPPAGASSRGSSSAAHVVRDTALWGSLVILAVVVLGVLFRRGRRVLRVWARPVPEGFPRAVRHLLRLLRRSGLLGRVQPTLRDLGAAAQQCGISDDHYRHFVTTVEGHWYGEHPPAASDTEKAWTTWHRWTSKLGWKTRRRWSGQTLRRQSSRQLRNVSSVDESESFKVE